VSGTVIARSSTGVMTKNHSASTATGTHQDMIPFQANGPVLKNGTRLPGVTSSAVHRQ